MQWTRSDTLALALNACTRCFGVGLLKKSKRGPESPCHCVLRSIFRACYQRFRECLIKEKSLSKVTLGFTEGGTRRQTWGRKNEEYLADFYLVSRRALTPEEFAVFKFHFLYGADWKLCTQRLNMDRGNFFHMVYRIENKLGRVYRETKPFALFPLDEYFQCQKRQSAHDLHLSTRTYGIRKRIRPVAPPVQRAA